MEEDPAARQYNLLFKIVYCCIFSLIVLLMVGVRQPQGSDQIYPSVEQESLYHDTEDYQLFALTSRSKAYRVSNRSINLAALVCVVGLGLKWVMVWRAIQHETVIRRLCLILQNANGPPNRMKIK